MPKLLVNCDLQIEVDYDTPCMINNESGVIYTYNEYLLLDKQSQDKCDVSLKDLFGRGFNVNYLAYEEQE